MFLSRLGGFCINFSENLFKQDLSEDRVGEEIMRYIPDLKEKIIPSALQSDNFGEIDSFLWFSDF